MTRSEPAGLADYVLSRRAQIDEALDRFLPNPPACPEIVREAMRYSLFAGGKRLRPVLTLAAAEAIAERSTPVSAPATEIARALALPAACAIELIHTYSLVHDDLPAMDDDTMRRGRPTLHVAYGEGLAILAGDALLTEAFALMAREPRPDGLPVASAEIERRQLAAIRVVAEAAGAAGMVGGQAIDLRAAATGTGLGAGELEGMHRRKTGALIRAAASAGAVMAGAAVGLVGAIDLYGAHLGLAFQIVDDILDVEGAAEQMGKTAGKDAASGKPTYPRLHGIEESRRLAAQSVGRARQALASVGLESGRLTEIAEWALTRRT